MGLLLPQNSKERIMGLTWVKEIMTVDLVLGYSEKGQTEALVEVNKLLDSGWRIIHIAQWRLMNRANPSNGQCIEQTCIILGR